MVDVEYILQAVEQVLECRRVLQYTYALGWCVEYIYTYIYIHSIYG